VFMFTNDCSYFTHLFRFNIIVTLRYKNFVRMKLRKDGQLELYAIGLDKVPTTWVLDHRHEQVVSLFSVACLLCGCYMLFVVPMVCYCGCC